MSTDSKEEEDTLKKRRHFPGSGVAQKAATVAQKTVGGTTHKLVEGAKNVRLRRSGSKKDPPQDRADSVEDASDEAPSAPDTSPESPVSDSYDEEEEVKETVETIVLGPTLDFLTADATISLILAISIAMVPTVRHWEAILKNELPSSVVASWLLVAYVSGQVFSIDALKKCHIVDAVSARFSSTQHLRSQAAIASGDSVQSMSYGQDVLDDSVSDARHRLLLSFFGGPGRRSSIRFSGISRPVRKAWSNLSIRRRPWKDVDPSRDEQSELVQFLLKNPYFRRAKRQAPEKDADLEQSTTASDSSEVTSKISNLGKFDLGRATAESLDDFVVDPLFRLRGMDVFLADELENEIGTHPWLVSQGLRDVPTCIVNMITQWGHILIYFEMPVWCDNWDSIAEEPEDEENVKALKRFLKGDDDYRNERIKIIPALTDGPYAVKMLAPPKKERPLHCPPLLPLGWSKYDPEINSSGRKLCPALEITLDCVSNNLMRRMAGIVKRNLQRLSIDVAVVVNKPVDQEEEEPQCCVGLWRFDYINVDDCPQFPDRAVVEAEKTGSDPDVVRASQLVSLTKKFKKKNKNLLQ